jgi:FtsH-binding integral membrane protein
VEGRQVRAVWCAIFLAGVTISGLFLHGLTPDGGASNDVHSAVGATILLVAHVLLAVGFTVTMVWHLVDNRRRLLAFFKRRNARNLRCLLGYAALVGLLVASVATAIISSGPDGAGPHMVISLVLAAAGIGHGVRHATARRRRASRRVAAEARSGVTTE